MPVNEKKETRKIKQTFCAAQRHTTDITLKSFASLQKKTTIESNNN